MENEDRGALMVRYADARAAFIEADSGIDALHKQVAAAAMAIGDPNAWLMQGRARSFNAGNANLWLAELPGRDAIRELMTDWAEKRMAVRAAHAAIPDHWRAGIAHLPKGADT